MGIDTRLQDLFEAAAKKRESDTVLVLAAVGKDMELLFAGHAIRGT